MAWDETKRRRWLGAIVLGVALLMLICGETVLDGRLRGMPSLAYWLTCFLLTCLAILAAFRDLRALEKRSRREQKDLLDATIKEIQDDATNKSKSRRNN